MTKCLSISAISLVCFGVGIAHAAGAATGASWWDTWSLQIYHAINLVLFIFVLVKLGGPPVVDALKIRSENISSEIQEANRLHQEAKDMLSEYGERLSTLEGEAQSILDDYRNMGEQERKRIVDQAQVEADRIRSESKKVAESELLKAKESIESEVIDQAINGATLVIVERLSDDEHARLTRDYFVELEASLENIPRSEA